MSQSSDPVVIVSCDTHIGPRLTRRPPRRTARRSTSTTSTRSPRSSTAPTARAATVADAHRRPRATTTPQRAWTDLNQDGTAAEVHLPRQPERPADPVHHLRPVGRLADAWAASTTSSYELAAVGRHIYNEWLADFCSVEPERHVGLAHLPMWDIDDAIEGSSRGPREHGLRGVNFPAESGPGESIQVALGRPVLLPRPGVGAVLGGVRRPRHDARDPRWRGRPRPTSPAAHPIWVYEAQEHSRKPIHRMIFAGVFERHPDLKLVLTEQPGQLVVHARCTTSTPLSLVRRRCRDEAERVHAPQRVPRRELPGALRGRGRASSTATGRTSSGAPTTRTSRAPGASRRTPTSAAEPAGAALHLPRARPEKVKCDASRLQRVSRSTASTARRCTKVAQTINAPTFADLDDAARRDPRRARHVGVPPARRVRLIHHSGPSFLPAGKAASMVDTQRFAGKAVLVTGAASGIGRAVALRFASEGAQVLAFDLNGDGLKETAELAQDRPARSASARATCRSATSAAR